MTRFARTTAILAGCSAVLCWPLIWNGYAFTYWDTYQYLTRFATGTPSLDRPILYSIVVWFFSRVPAGLVVLAIMQAVVTTALLLLLFPRRWLLVALATAALALTPTVYHVATIMPDVATLWMAIAFAIVAVARDRRSIAIGACVIGGVILLHNSNLPIALAASPLLFLVRRARFVVAPIIAGVAGMVVQNLAMGAPPLSSPAVFFLGARMNQTDALDRALRAQKDPRHIEWSEQLAPLRREPEPFLWQAASPLRRDYPHWDDDVHQFVAARAFLAPVTAYGLRREWRDLLGSGKRNIGSLVASEYLLGGHETDAADREKIRAALRRVAPWDDERYAASREGRGERPVNWSIWKRMSRMMSGVAAAIAAAGTIALFTRRDSAAPRLQIATILAAVFVANVITCGLLSSPQTRYIERVFALPLIAVIAGIQRP